MNSTLKVWSRQSERWKNVGPPTRPSLVDTNLMQSLSIEALKKMTSSQYEVAILGVTPEIIQIAWPNNTNLKAFDQSEGMIEKLWRPNQNIKSDVKIASWQSLPLENGATNLVAGDGCFTALPSIDDYFDVLKEIKRVLANDGTCIMRYFVPNSETTSLADIVKEIQSRKIKNFGSLKWKIAMALVDPKTCSVEIKKVSYVFNEIFKDRIGLARNNLWDIETIETIDSYHSMPGHFTFPTFDKLLEILEDFFSVEQVITLDYELAKNCPTIVLQQK